MALADEKFMLFTSYRRDGRAVGTPVWLAELGPGQVGFTTGAESGKAKRLAHTPRVTLQACDRRGKATHGPVYEGTARMVSGDEFAPIRTAIGAKYGLEARLIGLAMSVGAMRRRAPAEAGRSGVIVTLADGGAD